MERDTTENTKMIAAAPRMAVRTGTPPAVIATLSRAIETVLAAPDLKQRLEIQGVELKFTPADEFARMTEQEFQSWGKVVESAKVRVD